MKKKRKTREVCWGIGKMGGGNLDILRKATKIPAICDKHQDSFLEILECNDCDVRID